MLLDLICQCRVKPHADHINFEDSQDIQLVADLGLIAERKS